MSRHRATPVGATNAARAPGAAMNAGLEPPAAENSAAPEVENNAVRAGVNSAAWPTRIAAPSVAASVAVEFVDARVAA
ncbi:MAG TPA: hypothetical protein VLV89_12415, partial [Candidatus Acidoferrum sp.]|nr:hypothetical protein [Candidatus Acidoferrum sp.]